MIYDVSVDTARNGAHLQATTAIARLIGTSFALNIPLHSEKITELPPL